MFVEDGRENLKKKRRIKPKTFFNRIKLLQWTLIQIELNSQSSMIPRNKNKILLSDESLNQFANCCFFMPNTFQIHTSKNICTGSNFKIHSHRTDIIRQKKIEQKGIAPFLRRSIFENWSRSHDRSRQLRASSPGSYFFVLLWRYSM